MFYENVTRTTTIRLYIMNFLFIECINQMMNA